MPQENLPSPTEAPEAENVPPGEVLEEITGIARARTLRLARDHALEHVSLTQVRELVDLANQLVILERGSRSLDHCCGG